MKQKLAISLWAPAIGGLIIVASACGCGPRVPQMSETEYELKTQTTTIATRVHSQNGDWNSLTEEEKAVFVKAYGNEAKAKEGLQKILDGLQYFSGGPGPSPTPPGAGQGTPGGGAPPPPPE